MKRRITSVIAGLAAALALAGAAGGAGTAARAASPAELPINGGGTFCLEHRDWGYDGGTQKFRFELCGTPDADQRRTGLVKDGSIHCGPTSLFNSLHYLAVFTGMPASLYGTDISDLSPHDPNDYGATTAWISWLGGKAGIDSEAKGSDLAENRAAFNAATAGARAAGWTTETGYTSADDHAEFGTMLALRLAYAPVQLSLGWYKKNGDGTYTRTGGHFVTVTRASGSSGTGTIEATLHDPYRDDAGAWNWLKRQSDVANEQVTLTRQVKTYKAVAKDGTTVTKSHAYWKITGAGYSTGDRVAFAQSFNWFSATPPGKS